MPDMDGYMTMTEMVFAMEEDKAKIEKLERTMEAQTTLLHDMNTLIQTMSSTLSMVVETADKVNEKYNEFQEMVAEGVANEDKTD